MHTSAPKPPVSARIASTGSALREFTVWVAPKSRGPGQLAIVDVDGHDLPRPGQAGARRSPRRRRRRSRTRRPSRRAPTPPVLSAAPRPAITPQPSRPAAVGGAAGSTFVHCPACDERLVGERADSERRRQRRAVAQRHLLRRVVRGEAVPGSAAQAGPARAAHRPPVEDDEVAGRDVGDAVADRLDDAGGLVAEQEREVVVDPALAVVQVGVAHAAGLHRDHRLAGAGVGHQHRGEFDGRVLLPGDNALDSLHSGDRRHETASP